MSDINLGICPICKVQFDLSDGVPCNCIQNLEEDAEREMFGEGTDFSLEDMGNK